MEVIHLELNICLNYGLQDMIFQRLKKMGNKKIITKRRYGSWQSFIINLRKDKFKDIRVRKAIGLMFNFEWSNKTLFYDLYARINSFWENSDMAATGKPSKDELIILNSLKNTLPSGIIDSDVAEVSVSSTKQLDRKIFEWHQNFLMTLVGK